MGHAESAQPNAIDGGKKRIHARKLERHWGIYVFMVFGYDKRMYECCMRVQGIMDTEPNIYAMTYFGLFYDITVGVGLLFPFSFYPYLAGSVFFHCMNKIMFGIGNYRRGE